LPVYGQTVALLAARFPGLVPVVPAAGAVADTVRSIAAGWPLPPLVVSEIAGKHDAFAAASAALTKSGTSTLELALASVPMAVTYRVNALTAMIARRLIRVPHVAMVNLLAGREVVPELLQEDCTPERLAATVSGLITAPDLAAAQREAFRALLATLHPPAGLPSEAAAGAVLEILDQA
jgi:lipid-A-disaccharide synthase